ICRRSRASDPATSRARSTCRGARPPTTTAPSSLTTNWPRSTPVPDSTDRRKRLPTVESGNVRRTPGSSCRNCWGIRTSRTTTAVGRNTAPWWGPQSSWEADMCSAPKQGQTLPASVDLEKETVITGRVGDSSGQAVGGSFVRLLDSSGEFTAEVVASATGDFRFFAAPGSWTLRALSAAGNGDAIVEPKGAGIHEVDIKIS